MSKPDNDWDVEIAKFLAGEASPEEAAALHTWLDESEANRKIFALAEVAWAYASTDTYKKPDTAAAYRTLKTATRAKRNYFTPLRMAASLLLGTCIAVGIYFGTRTTQAVEHPWITKVTTETHTAWVLPEGSAITLNSNSRLRYPKIFEHTRTAELTGEAYFNVTPDSTKPFIISTDEVQVKVLGTKFNVSAHAVDSLVRVQVVQGKVMVSHGTDSIILVANQHGFYRKSTRTLWIEETETNNNLGYATHTFTYEDRSLRTILKDLSTAYHVTFELSNARVNDCHLTGEYHDMSLPVILEVVCRSLDLTYRITGNRVYISGDGCL
jgi:transmembrane sensor